ncbi:unnamed protein product, partial [marine sediment metagenome]
MPTASPSFCQILKDINLHKSLGLFKPSDIQFFYKKRALPKTPKQKAPYEQYRLFDKRIKPLEQIPFDFYYTFKCFSHPDCPSHTLKIHDWEITESYRDWRRRYKDQNTLLQKIEEKWLEIA